MIHPQSLNCTFNLSAIATQAVDALATASSARSFDAATDARDAIVVVDRDNPPVALAGGGFQVAALVFDSRLAGRDPKMKGGPLHRATRLVVA